jgi:hypothetical protein
MAFRRQGPPADISSPISDDDILTLDDITEQLSHLNNSAKRQRGTAYYERAHGRINATLDLWEIAAAHERTSA